MPDSGSEAGVFAAAGVVHEAHKHDSADKQVLGAAFYIDDLPEPPGLLHLCVHGSKRARARITRLDLTAVRGAPGVRAVLTPADIPGRNDISPFSADEGLFADGEVMFMGQPLFAVAAESLPKARAAASLAVVDYEDLPPILTIGDARAAGSTLEPRQTMGEGDAHAALKAAAASVEGTLAIGGQEHFYLEGQVALVIPGEDGDLHVFSSTQHPTETQHILARVLGKPDNAITVEVRRMGGAFGGKETQSVQWAAMAALAASKTGRPAKIRLDRDEDMVMTGKRHDFETRYALGLEPDGRVVAAVIGFDGRCGCSADLSAAINDRAMFHADNCYALPAVEITSDRWKTNTVSATAFRGFGGPQGMMVIERALDAAAIRLGLDPLDVRKRNLYGVAGDLTPYGQIVEDAVALDLMETLERDCAYRDRRAAIVRWNEENATLKRGLALTPVKFGISFTNQSMNQAGALVHVYTDGSIHLNHGGTEMGQGLNIKVAQVVAEVFQVPLSAVKISATRTDKVPNTSPTAASSGSDLNGMAAFNAAETIKDRLVAFAAETYGCAPERVVFTPAGVQVGETVVSFRALASAAHLGRVSLSSTGYYRTPEIHYDRKRHKGRPFFYFAYGAACSEVAIDTLTGEYRLLRVDILHDAGRSLNPAIDLGQVEGGFIQGVGWLTTEELVWNAAGRLTTHAPSTYKIPTAGDRPAVFNVRLWDKGRNVMPTIHRSKAVGEPPLMLAISVFSALTDAVASIGGHAVMPVLDAPATAERVLAAVEDVRQRAAEAAA